MNEVSKRRLLEEQAATSMEEAIMNSMVLYYNPKREVEEYFDGIYTRSTLKDLSGNGHDMTLYNQPTILSYGNVSCCLNFTGGLNQYGLVENLPPLTKEKGFTVVCSRTIQNYNSTSGTQNGCIASKRIGWSNNSKTAFIFEGIIGNRQRCDSFGTANVISDVNYNHRGWSYMTPQLYGMRDFEGNPRSSILASGDTEDSTILYINYPGDNSLTGRPYCSTFNLYCFILFNRVLTDEEILWVHDNLVDYYDDPSA